MPPTLKQLNQTFFIDGLLEHVSSRKATELHFVQALLPDEFLMERYEVSSSFKNYEGGHNPTRNRIFNGKAQLSYSHQDRIVALFGSHPEMWNSFIKKCHRLTCASACNKELLEKFLLSSFQDLEQSGLSKEYCEHIRSACSIQQDMAVATAVFYALLGGNIMFLSQPSLNPSAVDSPSLNYLNTCLCFLRNSIKPLLYVEEAKFQTSWDLYAQMFAPIATVSRSGRSFHPEHLLDYLYNNLTPKLPHGALHVEGPSGSDKNALLQLLFLKLCRDYQKDPDHAVFAPFYITLNYYENRTFSELVNDASSIQDVNHLFETHFELQLQEFKAFCKMTPHLLPIVFIDGIRNYNLNELGIPLDTLLSKCLRSVQNLRYIIGVDIGLSGEAPRRRDPATLLGTRYAYTVKISSLALYQKELSLQFLNSFCCIYDYSFQGLYEKLVHLSFYTVDAYQLRILYPLLETTSSIGQLYDAYCQRFFDEDAAHIDSAAFSAYQFTYTDTPIPLDQYYSDSAWLLMRRHSSFIDYFIARYYVRCLLPRAQSGQDLDGINIVFPKTITRFISTQLNRNPKTEAEIVRFIGEHYYELGTLAKSEMTYWLGRIQHRKPRQHAFQLLSKFYQDSSKSISRIRCAGSISREQKEELFLHRGIAVSLIYLGNQNISNEYIKSLIQDPVAAEINRGFHLEYYGDIPYLPTVDSLSYSDDLKLGEKTLTQLFLICDNSITAKEFHPAFDLCLFTICSLIQVRVSQAQIRPQFDLVPHIRHMTELLHIQLSQKHSTSEFIQEYFSMMLTDGLAILQRPGSAYYPVQSTLYNYYSELKDVPRSGWVTYKIPNPENISTHMYNGWLMAFLLLPDVTSENDHYSKDAVMKTLLIHDLAERTTGDIERPIKDMDWSKYQKQENYAMAKLLFKGTYPSIGSMNEEYQLWEEWVSLSTYNAKVAKDIDRIQAVYQLCEYLLTYRDHFTEEKISQWVNEYHELHTQLGQSLFRTLILANEKFASLHLEQIIPLS